MATGLPVGPDGTEAEGAPPGLPLVRAATLDGGGTPGPEDEHPAATTVSTSTEAIWTRLRTRRMLRAGRPASRSCPARGLCRPRGSRHPVDVALEDGVPVTSWGDTRFDRRAVVSAAEHLPVTGVARGILLGKGVDRPFSTLPLRDRRQAADLWNEPRPPYELVAVDVARAVRVDRPHPHPDDELGLRVVLAQRVLHVDARGAVESQAVAALDVDEEQAHCRVDQDVARGQVHAVAVVAGKGQRVRVQHTDEARLAALVGAGRPALGVGCREEEHVAVLDEPAVRLADGVADEQRVDPLGQGLGVEAILQEATAAVEADGHERS